MALCGGQSFAFLFFLPFPNLRSYAIPLGAIFTARLSPVATRRTSSAVESRKDANARLRVRLPAVPKPPGNHQPSQCRSERALPLCPAGTVSRAPQFANMYYERRKGKYFGDALEDERIPRSRISSGYSSHKPP